MRILRFLGLGAIAALPLGSAAGAAGAAEPIAIVYSLTGKASFAAPHAGRRSLRLFDRLPAGTTLEAGPRSRLALAFVNGLRYELGERSRARLGPRGLASRIGLVRPLSPLPAHLLPIAARDHPGPRAAAIRVRAEEISGLYPLGGAAVLVETTVLRFRPVAGATRYRIAVQDGRGRTVFAATVESPPVKVPAGKLRAGLTYSWTVQTVDRPGPIARGEAELVTLDAGVARAREKARKMLVAEGPDSLQLLAEIDRSLGLLLEARDELGAALREKPGDPVLREALARIEMRLESVDDSG